MIFIKHVRHRLAHRAEAERVRGHVRETAARVPGVSLRDFLILADRDEFILLMECPDEAAYREWRALCPPPPGAIDWVETALRL
jgi:hypothetical protein